MSNSEFIKTINIFVKKGKASLDEIPRVAGIKILAQLVEMSPVGNPDLWSNPKAPPGYTGGRFRGNWQVTFDIPATQPVDRIDKSGSQVKSAGNLALGEFRSSVHKSICFTNALPYAYRLEMGHSSQAPEGMIAVTAEAFTQFFKQAVEEFKK